jgi:hypothetical protein
VAISNGSSPQPSASSGAPQVDAAEPDAGGEQADEEQ